MGKRISKLSLMLSMVDDKTKSVARRMFATNAVDALLAVLGAIVAQYIAGVSNAVIMISSALGISLVMGILSGVVATLLVESAEQKAEIKHVEQVMVAKLSNSVLYRGSIIASIYVALWSGTGMVLMPIIGISPLIVHTSLGVGSYAEAVWATIILIDMLLFGLGAWLGKLAGEQWFIWGLKFLAIGLAVTLITFIISH